MFSPSSKITDLILLFFTRMSTFSLVSLSLTPSMDPYSMTLLSYFVLDPFLLKDNLFENKELLLNAIEKINSLFQLSTPRQV